MDYLMLTAEMRTDLLRKHLLQAEADHFVHSLQAESVRAAQAQYEPGTVEHQQAGTQVEQLERLATAALSKCVVITTQLTTTATSS
jgi:hypothetical protein